MMEFANRAAARKWGKTGVENRIEFVTVGWYWNPLAAWLVRNRLVEEGLRAFVVDEFVPTVNWFYANAVRGIKVQVPRSEADAAQRVLASSSADVFGPVDAPKRPGERTKCSRCKSRNVGRERYSLRAVFLSLFVFGFPLPIRSTTQCCFDCGHREGIPATFTFRFTIADILVFTLLVAIVLGLSQLWLELAVAPYRNRLP
jgi:hypothetical protein